MFIDGRTLNGTVQEATLCIVGSGAAGIAIATQFLKDKNVSVIMLESGGLANDDKAQSLCDGIATGLPYDIKVTRLRYFGGSTNHWAGWCTPLEAKDFEARSWIKHSGWPFGIEELTPYYQRASQFLNVSGSNTADFQVPQDLLPGQKNLEFHCWRNCSNLRLGEIHHKDLQASDNIRILLNSCVNEISVNDSASQVKQISAVTAEGQSFTVRAKHYVLACGGIENPRLLLLSRRQIAQGLANEHDLVGRYFMEHPHIMVGSLVAFGQPKEIGQFMSNWQEVCDLKSVYLNITPTSAAMKEHRILNAALEIAYRDWTNDKNFLEEIASLKKPPEELLYMRKVSKNPNADFSVIPLYSRSEPAPNPDSRVTLSATRRDALGMPVAEVNWELGEQDWNTIRTMAILAGQAISSLGLGVVHLFEWARTFTKWPDTLYWGCHHIGTTRMHDNPRQGVVDRNCRIHGIENLHIAGSSVFPTAGWANPTYTIIALSLRLADRLKQVLQES